MDTLLEMERESVVLLKNNNDTLPLKKAGSVALLGPLADYVSVRPGHGFLNYAGGA